MNKAHRSKSRRTFLQLGSGAVLAGSAGLAAGRHAFRRDGGGDSLLSRPKERIRTLQMSFMELIAERAYEAAAALFDDRAHVSLSGVSATGRDAILDLLAVRYRRQEVPVLHSGYRWSHHGNGDTVELSTDGRAANALFHVDAEVCTPLRSNCTVAQMARLCGHHADRRWEAGRFEAKCLITSSGDWRFARLTFEVLRF